MTVDRNEDPQTDVPPPIQAHPREILKNRLAEFGQHLIDDSLSGVFEFLMHCLSGPAASLLPLMQQHLDQRYGAAETTETSSTNAVHPSAGAAVTDNFDGGWLVGQIDTCRMVAEHLGWTIPDDIFMLMHTGRIVPMQAVQLLLCGGSRDAVFDEIRKAAQVQG